MDKLFRVAKIGIGLSVILGLTYIIATWNIKSANQAPPYSSLILEAFKTLLTFSLITTGGVVIKALIDQVLEEDRDSRTDTNRYEETRKIIIKEFTIIFSEFYSIKKLHDSALVFGSLYERNSNEFKLLSRQLLQKCVDLEGRYGALKVSSISHFGLPGGNFSTKDKFELKEQILATEDKRHMARHKIDLLGEIYDEWRHAVEQSRKIEADKGWWGYYSDLLKFLESAE